MNTTGKPTFSVGETVAIIRGGYDRTARLAQIDRETKMYWIIGDAKFRKADLQAPGGNAWTPMSRIEKADSPYVEGLLKEQAQAQSFSRLLGIVEALKVDRDNPKVIRQVIKQAEEYRDLIESDHKETP